MSLINDVLKDLERRDAMTDRAQARSRTSRPAPKRRRWTWAIWGLAALASGAILHLSLQAPGSRHAGDSDKLLTAQSMPASDAANPLNAATPEAAVTTTPGKVSAEQAASRQPMPSGQGSPRSSDPSVAGVDAADPASRQAERTDEARNEAPSRNTSHEEPEPAPETAPPSAEVAEDENGSDDAAGRAQANISIERADSASAESEPLVDARRLLSRGQTGRAEARLRSIIAEQPSHGEAYELLARSLLRQGRSRQAVSLLQDGLVKADGSSKLAALLARVLIERDEVGRARDVLADHAPEMGGHSDYHLLLAATYRQAGDHLQAADHYRRLSEILPHQGTVWVGLGASLEALERPAEARDAYLQALDGDGERARAFARSRLRALETMTGADP